MVVHRNSARTPDASTLVIPHSASWPFDGWIIEGNEVTGIIVLLSGVRE